MTDAERDRVGNKRKLTSSQQRDTEEMVNLHRKWKSKKRQNINSVHTNRCTWTDHHTCSQSSFSSLLFSLSLPLPLYPLMKTSTTGNKQAHICLFAKITIIYYQASLCFVLCYGRLRREKEKKKGRI